MIPGLNKLNEWTTKREDIRVGDVCVIFEEKTRGVWPIGVVTERLCDSDGHARRDIVRCGGSRVLERSLSWLLIIQEVQKVQM